MARISATQLQQAYARQQEIIERLDNLPHGLEHVEPAELYVWLKDKAEWFSLAQTRGYYDRSGNIIFQRLVKNKLTRDDEATTPSAEVLARFNQMLDDIQETVEAEKETVMFQQRLRQLISSCTIHVPVHRPPEPDTTIQRLRKLRCDLSKEPVEEVYAWLISEHQGFGGYDCHPERRYQWSEILDKLRGEDGFHTERALRAFVIALDRRYIPRTNHDSSERAFFTALRNECNRTINDLNSDRGQQQRAAIERMEALTTGLEEQSREDLKLWLVHREHVLTIQRSKAISYDEDAVCYRELMSSIVSKLCDDDGQPSVTKVQAFCSMLEVFQSRRRTKDPIKYLVYDLQKNLSNLCLKRSVALLTDAERAGIIQRLDELKTGLEEVSQIELLVWLQAKYAPPFLSRNETASEDEYNQWIAHEEAMDNRILGKLTQHSSVAIMRFMKKMSGLALCEDDRVVTGSPNPERLALRLGLSRLESACFFSLPCDRGSSFSFSSSSHGHIPVQGLLCFTDFSQESLNEARAARAGLIPELDALTQGLEAYNTVQLFVWLKNKCDTFYSGHPGSRAIADFNAAILGKLTRRQSGTTPALQVAASFEKKLGSMITKMNILESMHEPRLPAESKRCGFYRGLKALQQACSHLIITNQYVRKENRSGHNELEYQHANSERPSILANRQINFAGLRGDRMKTSVRIAMAEYINEHAGDPDLRQTVEGSSEYELLATRQNPWWGGRFFKRKTDSEAEIDRMLECALTV